MQTRGRELWCSELDDEMSYWRGAFREPAPDFRDRMNPERRFRDEEAVLHLARHDRLRVLDVGAGPVTNLGYTHPSCRIEVVAVDALALEFARLMREYDCVAPTPTLCVEGERVAEVFPPDCFDAAYATNALDHCYDPLAVLDNMFEVVRPEGAITLLHYERVGQLENYHGLHQWDLYIEDGVPMLGNRGGQRVVDLGQRFGVKADVVTCQRGSIVGAGGRPQDSCLVRFRKHPRLRLAAGAG